MNFEESNSLFKLNKNEYIDSLILEGAIELHSDDNLTRGCIEIGQTYIGQMITHDIVPSTSHLNNRLNVSTELNLDSLYGDADNPAYFDKNGKFILGNAIEGVNEDYLINDMDLLQGENDIKLIKDMDLLRDKDGKALIPDIRNDENVIISQLHLLWQKLHNSIHEELKSHYGDKHCFKITQEIVIKIFHEIVIYDYLSQVLHSEIHNLYFGDSDFFFHYSENQLDKIPDEFAHAVFRFGHSMIRNKYQLNLLEGVEDIAIENFLNNRNRPLNSKNIINWELFFVSSKLYDCPFHCYIREQYAAIKEIDIPLPIDGFDIPVVTSTFASTMSASKIDTLIAESLKNVPFINNTKQDLRKIDLRANLDKVKLSGEHVRHVLIKKKELTEFLNCSIYQDKSLKCLPLWIYVLKEAELNSSISGNECHGLGFIGSIITAEVLKASMLSVKFSNSEEYTNAFDYIKSRIKDIQKDVELRFPYSESVELINNFTDNSPITMGNCINYINRRKNNE